MAIQNDDSAIERMLTEGDDARISTETAIGAITRSEVDAQISAAHRFPRSIGKFLRQATTLATVNRDVAESCLYSVPRDGKMLSGPSVRLSELCASAYGNLHYGARVIETDETHVTAQGIAWDLENNVRVTVETKRRITGRNGRRFSDDMITLTGNAAASIALRNALFRVIPRAYVNHVYERARELSIGNAQSLSDRRSEILARIAKAGVPQERVLTRLEKATVEDITLEDIEILIGLGNAIKEGSITLDAAFPEASAPVAPPEHDGRRMKLGNKD